MNRAANNRKDKLFNFRPALFAAIFLILGIGFSYYRITEKISVAWLLLFVPVVAIVLCFAWSKENFAQRVLALVLLFIFFFAGSISFRLQIEKYQDCPPLEGEYTLVATVESCKEGEDYVKLVLRDISMAEAEVDGRFNAYLPIPFGKNYAVGDKILITGEVEENTELFNEYGFRDSAISKKIRYTMYADGGTIVGKSDSLVLGVRARMEEVVFAGMDELPASLTLALLTGDASDMDEGVMENMRYGGISHIFAVSGLNVGALFAFCLLLFSKTPMRRTPKWLRFLSVVGILIFYSAICCFTASVVRAAIMCAVGYLVKLLEVGSDLLESLGIAAILILLLFPSELFGVGFQLSFLACVGLFLLARPIGQVFDELQKAFRKRFPRKYTEAELKALKDGDTLPLSVGEGIYRGVSGLLSASIAAQITTAPVLLLRFGYLSGWSLLLNFIFVPFTDAIFTVLLVAVVFCCLLPTALSGIVLYLPSVVWTAAMLVFEGVDFSTFAFTDVPLTLVSCICYYAGVCFFSDKLNLPKFVRVCFALAFFGVFFLSIIVFSFG